ncbi:ArsR/SmtB family transcription factor [Bordetella tumulicola]|uniref:ArsR/SmtB family transcription factor n=1 Tax=Bordetella tumulicola TaxID=1649133 RepID=UPI0039EEA2A3
MDAIDIPASRAQATVSAIDIPICSRSENLDVAAAFGAIGHTTRLGILRTLIQQEPYGIEAGKLASLVGGPRSTVSQHLASLAKAGLVVGVRTQEEVRYRANLEGLYGLLELLLQDCCRENDGVCIPNDRHSSGAFGFGAR